MWIEFHQFAELMIRGKGLFSRSDILAALTSNGGDINQAFNALRPPPEEPSGSPLLPAAVHNSIGINFDSFRI